MRENTFIQKSYVSFKKVFAISIAFVFFSSIPFHAQTDSLKHKNSGFLDPNVYYDSRQMAVLSVNSLVNLPARFQYFGTYNFFSDTRQDDLSTYYVENQLFWTPRKNLNLDLTQYWVSQSGSSNDALKYGFRWRLSDAKGLKKSFEKIKGFYYLNFYLLDVSNLHSNGVLNQLQHVYRINFQSKRRANWGYFSGFANQYHFIDDRKLKVSWVTEHQVGFRLWNSFYLVGEYRLNQFINSSQGLGIGLEYFIIL